MTDKQDWPPEPWSRNAQGTPKDSFHGWVQDAKGNPVDGASDINWDRVVACVNACAGIPTEDLLGDGLNGIMKSILKYLHGEYGGLDFNFSIYHNGFLHWVTLSEMGPAGAIPDCDESPKADIPTNP